VQANSVTLISIVAAFTHAKTQRVSFRYRNLWKLKKGRFFITLHNRFLGSGSGIRRCSKMATMTSLIGLINKIQRACTVLGDHGGEGMSLWEALPTVAVVGGQVLLRSHRFYFVATFLCFWDWLIVFVMNNEPEFREIVSVGKCRGKGFSATWIW